MAGEAISSGKPISMGGGAHGGRSSYSDVVRPSAGPGSLLSGTWDKTAQPPTGPVHTLSRVPKHASADLVNSRIYPAVTSARADTLTKAASATGSKAHWRCVLGSRDTGRRSHARFALC